jgi:pyridoxine 5-phosphate synthase
MTLKLHVNVDHVATLRQARGTSYPDPVWAASLCELAGADGITVHLRGDRRHIKEADLRRLRELVTTRLNLEMAANDGMSALALIYRPDMCTLVPENPGEVTTEGGLDLKSSAAEVRSCLKHLSQEGIRVSLFIDPSEEQILRAVDLGAPIIEINTRQYAEAVPKGLEPRDTEFQKELATVTRAASLAASKGLVVYAGHGLTYRNVKPISDLPEIEELNIGHNIIARAALVGLERAVRDMKELLR